MTNSIVSTIYFTCVCIFTVGPILSLYILHKSVIGSEYIKLGYYGIVILLYYTLQSIFAVRNHFLMKTLSSKTEIVQPKKIAMIVVGYQEDPELFRNCLRATKNVAGHEKLIIVIDGNEEEDMKMFKIYQEVFGTFSPFAHLDSYHQLPMKINTFKMNNVICVTQPHNGKREALYTGIKAAICLGMDAVLLTDSDTCVDPSAINELEKVLFSDDTVGAVTGDVRIYNSVNAVSFLASLKYYFSFNIERGAQSYFGCVACVSGPLGFYRISCLEKIIEDWKTQKFCGKLCTFGDDRHLTNRVLSMAMKVKYTHLAFCYTETPTLLRKWILQQTRWSKSFFRELLFNVGWIYNQSLWLAIELSYQVFYPFLVLYTIIDVLVFENFSVMLFWIAVVLGFNFIRGVTVSVVEKDMKFILYGIYALTYISLIIPVRVYAFLGLIVDAFSSRETCWLTSTRTRVQKWVWSSIILPIVWNLFIVAFFIKNVIYFLNSDHTVAVWISLSVIGSFIVIEISLIMLLKIMKKLNLKSYQQYSQYRL